MNMWDFFNNYPFIAWCCAWLLWGFVPLVQSLLFTIRRILRYINISIRGWPPAHLDANGDFKPIPIVDYNIEDEL